MRNYKDTVYFAGSRRPEHKDLNGYILDALIDQFGLKVVGDSSDPDPARPSTYAKRVDAILETCLGMVVVLPRTDYSQTTASTMFLEILLAVRHGLPLLFFCEDSVQMEEWNRDGKRVRARFGPPGGGVLTPDDVDPLTFTDRFRLYQACSIEFETSTFLNRPLMLPRKPEPDEARDGRVLELIETFIQSFATRAIPYVFNIMAYASAHERLVIADAVADATGLRCVNGSDAWSGAPYSREELIGLIANACFVIADLSDVRAACVYETGVAIGTDRKVGVVMRPSKTKLPFGPDKLPMLIYRSDRELDQAVRQFLQPYRQWWRVFNAERPQNPPTSAGIARRTKKVLLIHGIRTRAGWMEMVKGVLGTADTDVQGVKYGFLDLMRFWFPFWTRRPALATVKRKVAAAIEPGRELIVIAHSFGTYAVVKLMEEVPGFRPSRLLLCGSIVPENYRWDLLDNSPAILNDCSVRDVLPVLAVATTWGYGASGTFGFGTPGVTDRFHEFGHSDYFDRGFVERYWAPWVEYGRVEESPYAQTGRRPKYWLSLLTVRAFRLLSLGVLGLLLYVTVWK